MKRNWEIIREILIKLEESHTPKTTIRAEDIHGFDEQEIAYNMRLLKEAGCIDADLLESTSGDGLIISAMAERLRNTGHDLLDSMRNDNIWNKTKETFISKGVDMTIDLVIAAGKKISMSLLDL